MDSTPIPFPPPPPPHTHWMASARVDSAVHTFTLLHISNSAKSLILCGLFSVFVDVPKSDSSGQRKPKKPKKKSPLLVPPEEQKRKTPERKLLVVPRDNFLFFGSMLGFGLFGKLFRKLYLQTVFTIIFWLYLFYFTRRFDLLKPA